MEIISHRGFWINSIEKNTTLSFERSFKDSFGTETDIRDYNGKLVISHDIATQSSIILEDFFQMYKDSTCNKTLALNIKSDGLAKELKQYLEKFDIKKYFVFDMSIPDTLAYLNNEINIFTRQSEYEPVPAFYNKCSGIWLDSFVHENWITQDVILNHIQNGKKVAIVSPDLHKREYRGFWSFLRDTNLYRENSIILCTDYPMEARFFFNL